MAGAYQRMITTKHVQEALSRSYVSAIAAMAGVDFSLGHEFDYGFDGTFRPVSLRNNRRVVNGYPLDFQLKCTKNWAHEKENVAYNIETKTYNDMVSRAPSEIGAMLILLCIPDEECDWAQFSEDYMTLRRCCYYAKITGNPVENEKSTKKILIPRVNILTGESLKVLLNEERLRITGGKPDGEK